MSLARNGSPPLHRSLRHLLAFALVGSVCRAQEPAAGTAADHSRRGDQYFRQREYSAAIEEYTEAIRLNPNDAWVWEHRACCRHELRDNDGALKDFDSAVRLNPASGWPRVKRGEVRWESGDVDGAKEDYAEAARLAPDNIMVQGWTARFFEDTGNLDLGIQARNEILRLDPEHIESLRARGVARAAQGNFTGARADLDEALRIDPRDGESYSSRAGLRYDWGDYCGALADVRESLKYHCRVGNAYEAILGMLCRLRLGEKEAADAQLRGFTIGSPSERSREGWSATIAAFLQGEIQEEAFLKAMESPDARTANEQACEAWYYAGFMRLIRGDATTAEAYFRKCIAVGLFAFWEHKHAVAELGRIDVMK